jgi:hypothetical protein
MREALDTEGDFLEQGMVVMGLVWLLVLLLLSVSLVQELEENVSWVGRVHKGQEHEHSRHEQAHRCSDNFLSFSFWVPKCMNLYVGATSSMYICVAPCHSPYVAAIIPADGSSTSSHRSETGFERHRGD